MNLHWTTEARQDRRDIHAHIDKDNPAAAARLDDDFRVAAEKLAQRPGIGRPGRLPPTREWVVRPSYILVYLVMNDAVYIVRVLHTSRRWPPLQP